MHACSLWRPQMMDMGVKSSVSCSWFLYLKVTTVSHLGALGLYKTEVVDLRSMGWPFSLVYAVTVHWAVGSGVSPPSSAWPSLSLGSGTGVVCMCLWLGGSQTPGSCLDPVSSKDRVWGGIRLDSPVLSPLGRKLWSQMLLWGSGLLKGDTPKGPLDALDFWEPQLQSPVPEVAWSIGPRTQDSVFFHEAFRLCCYNGSILNFYQSIQ